MFFNGFALEMDEAVKNRFYHASDFTIAGFSYGAQRAVEEALQSSQRIDSLLLFSPAFFQHYDDAFKIAQLNAYEKSPQTYMKRFVKNAVAPYNYTLSVGDHSKVMLQSLLFYNYVSSDLKKLVERGIAISVYASKLDKVVSYEQMYAFFKPYATITTFNSANHLLYRAPIVKQRRINER